MISTARSHAGESSGDARAKLARILDTLDRLRQDINQGSER